ncbi:MAG TPA: sugar transferase [Terracidiphilus sp.]
MDTSNSWEKVLPSLDIADRAAPGREAGDPAALAKRTLDITIALSGAVLLAPLAAAMAIAMKVESRGPVLFVSRRLGRDGHVFRCVKFRTMTADGQVTRLGGLLRRFGLDELPQLVNVLRGEMSLVGPRPVMAADSPESEVPRLRRFEVNPGMTGLWALHQAHWSELHSYISPDESYRKNWSVWLDVVILMRCLGAALAGRGH